MEIVTLTDERKAEILPKNIAESDVLSDEAKTVMAVLLNYQLVNKKAREKKFVAISNPTLAKSCTMGVSKTLGAVQELVEHNLVTRKAGQTKRFKSDIGVASEYRIQFQNLNKPITKNTFEDLFADFLESLETPSGITNTNTDSDTDTKSVSESNTYTDTKLNLPFLDKTDTYLDLEESDVSFESTMRVDSSTHKTLREAVRTFEVEAKKAKYKDEVREAGRKLNAVKAEASSEELEWYERCVKEPLNDLYSRRLAMTKNQ